jgi:hypothetical protein
MNSRLLDPAGRIVAASLAAAAHPSTDRVPGARPAQRPSLFDVVERTTVARAAVVPGCRAHRLGSGGEDDWSCTPRSALVMTGRQSFKRLHEEPPPDTGRFTGPGDPAEPNQPDSAATRTAETGHHPDERTPPPHHPQRHPTPRAPSAHFTTGSNGCVPRAAGHVRAPFGRMRCVATGCGSPDARSPGRASRRHLDRPGGVGPDWSPDVRRLVVGFFGGPGALRVEIRRTVGQHAASTRTSTTSRAHQTSVTGHCSPRCPSGAGAGEGARAGPGVARSGLARAQGPEPCRAARRPRRRSPRPGLRSTRPPPGPPGSGGGRPGRWPREFGRVPPRSRRLAGQPAGHPLHQAGAVTEPADRGSVVAVEETVRVPEHAPAALPAGARGVAAPVVARKRHEWDRIAMYAPRTARTACCAR